MVCFTKEEVNECLRQELLKLYCHALQASHKWITASGIIAKGEGVLAYGILTAAAVATAVSLYDGHDTNGEPLVTLETSITQSRPYSFHDHLIFHNGLYVAVDANILGLLLVWHPIPFGMI